MSEVKGFFSAVEIKHFGYPTAESDICIFQFQSKFMEVCFLIFNFTIIIEPGSIATKYYISNF